MSGNSRPEECFKRISELGRLGKTGGLEDLQSANDGAQIEDHPEPGDVLSLTGLVGITHHDGALSSPQHTATDTKQSSGEDDKAFIGGMIVAEIARDVEEIAHTSQAEGQLDAQAIGNSAGEEADDAEGAVNGDVGIVGCRSIELASTTDTVDGIEHARAQETDESHKNQLDGRAGIVRNGDGSETAWGVFPAGEVGCDDIEGRCWWIAAATGGGNLGLADRSSLLVLHRRHDQGAWLQSTDKATSEAGDCKE